MTETGLAPTPAGGSPVDRQLLRVGGAFWVSDLPAMAGLHPPTGSVECPVV
jgi:hypothetical protein